MIAYAVRQIKKEAEDAQGEAERACQAAAEALKKIQGHEGTER
jgi:hypothetical protein